jgi:hypothetical protein
MLTVVAHAHAHVDADVPVHERLRVAIRRSGAVFDAL